MDAKIDRALGLTATPSLLSSAIAAPASGSSSSHTIAAYGLSSVLVSKKANNVVYLPQELKPDSSIFLVSRHGISSESFDQRIADALNEQPLVIKVLHCNHEIGCSGSLFLDTNLYISKTEITTTPILAFRWDDKISAVENNLHFFPHPLRAQEMAVLMVKASFALAMSGSGDICGYGEIITGKKLWSDASWIHQLIPPWPPPKIVLQQRESEILIELRMLKNQESRVDADNTLILFKGHDGTKTSNGDVLIFPDMIHYRRLTHVDVDTFVEEVLVKDNEWLPGTFEPLSGSYIFVCSHGSWDHRCGVCRTAFIARILGIRKVSVSKKYELECHLLHAITNDLPWYGNWGFKFGAGSFALTVDAYHKAIDTLSNMVVTLFLYQAQKFRTNAILCGVGYRDVAVTATAGRISQIKALSGSVIGGEDILQNVMRHLLPNLDSIFKGRPKINVCRDIQLLRQHYPHVNLEDKVLTHLDGNVTINIITVIVTVG
ncbi:hypothetical protein NE237_024349 [Protea cynaroides]|uniref:Uncharacterized protein n=1 Tax=Protea cynaroides TaxID=273540 RepID=A0A9Q0HEQ9_9MAGN|nr:hypothetical protein NE237_024349 [Protea cynaroides]